MQVTGFVLDWMHTVDGGILKRGIAYLFVVGKGLVADQLVTQYPNNFYTCANSWLQRWSKCLPYEFSRRPRSLDELDKWKMRETGMTGTYIIPAFKHVSEVNDKLDRGHYNAFLKLVMFCRLIGGFHGQRVPEDDINLAERLIRDYIKFISWNDRHDAVPYVAHSAAHLPRECRHYKGRRLGIFSSYPFENFIKYFKPVSTNNNNRDVLPPLLCLYLDQLFRNTGRDAVKAFLRRLANMAAYYDHELVSGKHRDMQGATFDAELELIRQRKTLELPPTAVLRYTSSVRSQKVECVGFTLTNRLM